MFRIVGEYGISHLIRPYTLFLLLKLLTYLKIQGPMLRRRVILGGGDFYSKRAIRGGQNADYTVASA